MFSGIIGSPRIIPKASLVTSPTIVLEPNYRYFSELANKYLYTFPCWIGLQMFHCYSETIFPWLACLRFSLSSSIKFYCIVWLYLDIQGLSNSQCILLIIYDLLLELDTDEYGVRNYFALQTVIYMLTQILTQILKEQHSSCSWRLLWFKTQFMCSILRPFNAISMPHLFPLV